MAKAGRKPLYTDPQVMQQKIDAYFESCEVKVLYKSDGSAQLDKWGNVVMAHVRPPTITGLALALGFTSRQSLLNYQGKAAFVDIITRAKLRVESYAEERLFDRDGAAGAKWALACNFGWREQPDGGTQSADRGEDQSGVVLLPEVSGGDA